jgi:hypothetical protein
MDMISAGKCDGLEKYEKRRIFHLHILTVIIKRSNPSFSVISGKVLNIPHS